MIRDLRDENSRVKVELDYVKQSGLATRTELDALRMDPPPNAASERMGRGWVVRNGVIVEKRRNGERKGLVRKG